jgi:lipoyl synthase
MASIGSVELSLAAAVVLGYRNGQFRRNALPTSLNLLLHYGEGCVGRCAYCGQTVPWAEGTEERTFIRVPWPVYPVEEVYDRVRSGVRGFQRVCVGMVTHRSAFDDMNAVIRLFSSGTALPVSALIAPTLIRDLGRLSEIKEAGADRIGIALDAATPEAFAQYRGAGVHGPHAWEHYWRAIEVATTIFERGNVGIHLMVGLGESEQAMVSLIQRLYDLGADAHLFSFFPEAGTAMGNHAPPSYGQYRRVQLARHIINHACGRVEQMSFDAHGRLTDFGAPIDDLLRYGEPFMTTGCSGTDGRVACNRPFGNERPSQPFRNFPVAPEPEDVALLRYQLFEYEDAR